MSEKKKQKKESAKDLKLAFEILAAHDEDLSSMDKKVEEMSVMLDKIKNRMGLWVSIPTGLGFIK